MVFINSLKLFGSNFAKTLKFFLFYIVVWGLGFALFLPAFFEFKELILNCLNTLSSAFVGVFSGSLGANIANIINVSFQLLKDALNSNLGLAVYGLIVVFIFLPFFVNIGKYTLNEMLYSYMTSKNELGFFSALVKSLKKSLLFAVAKTLYNLVFLGVTLLAVFGLSQIQDATFVTYFLPLCVFLVLVMFFTVHQITVLGWAPAMIVFNRNVFGSYRKGMKAVKRHFWASFGTTLLYFILFWAIVMVFGVYSLVALIPIMTALLCVYDMTAFFTSQGMRFYVNDNKILTPKRLEEVDNINKTAYIL
ncbi:MAG: hypothetical protein ACI4R8_01725 [Candidatus Caccovivens sp.]